MIDLRRWFSPGKGVRWHINLLFQTFGNARLFLVAGIFAGWATSSPAAVTLQIGQNFKGSTFGVDSHLTPADANGAVGPRHFVELINGRFSVYDKTNGSRVQTQTDLAFWRQAGVSFPTGWQTTDPRVVYDPAVERWFAGS